MSTPTRDARLDRVVEAGSRAGRIRRELGEADDDLIRKIREATPKPTCPIPREDGQPCGPVLSRGMCSVHYWRAWRAEHPRVPPGARPRELGNAPVQYAFYVPQELAQQVRAAVEASGLTKARWLEAAIRAQLERDPNATRAGRAR